MIKSRVAWCGRCKVYTAENEVGFRCPMMDCEWTLRLRLGYICPQCDENQEEECLDISIPSWMMPGLSFCLHRAFVCIV